MTDDFATTKILNSKSEKTVLLVGLEHGRVRVGAEVGLATTRIHEVTPVILTSQPKQNAKMTILSTSCW